MNIQEFDVVITGAGPAGCVLAHLLAKSGVRVALVEQHFSLDREFRGPGFQPSVMKIFDDVLNLPMTKVFRLQLGPADTPIIDIDLKQIKEKYNFLAMMSQGPLLNLLVEKSLSLPNFSYFSGTAVQGLYMDSGAVRGVVGSHLGESVCLKSRLLVSSDGRYSVIRKSADISVKKEGTTFDILWFLVSGKKGEEIPLRVELEQGGFTILIPQPNGGYQMGWLIPKGGFEEVRKKGFDRFLQELIDRNPTLEQTLRENLKNFNRVHLLDVQIGIAEEWARKGLVLIGDAAHIASPVGAQGNALAIQDAAFIHPLITRSLKEEKGVISPKSLEPFITDRKKQVEEVLGMQRRAQAMITRLQNPRLTFWIQLLLRITRRTSTAKKVADNFLWGPKPFDVASDEFREPQECFQRLTVKKIIKESEDAQTFVFDNTFSFQPGQFLTLRILIKGILYSRCYSISSENQLQITPKRIKGGIVSNYLHDEVHEGDSLLFLPPQGNFCLKEEMQSFVLIAGGSGITPLYSILSSALAERKSVHLIYANRKDQRIIFYDQLIDLQKKYPDQLKITHALSEKSNKIDCIPRLDKESLKSFFVPDANYFICGPQALQETALSALKEGKIEPEKIHVETFASERGVKETQARFSDQSEALVMGESDSSNPEESCEVLKLTLKNKNYDLDLLEGETILDSALRAKLSPPYSCREGVCATCKAKLLKGKVSMEKSSSLNEFDQQTGFILSCQAKPLTKEIDVDFDV